MTHRDTTDSVRARLLQAALDCFLADDYHQVSTRRIARKGLLGGYTQKKGGGFARKRHKK